jgi:hypothetical protein
VSALAAQEVPLLLSVTPLRSFEEADYLAHEVPGVTIPPDALRAMERAGRGSARAVGIELAADLLRDARKLVSGVILTAAEEDLTVLAPVLAVVALGPFLIAERGGGTSTSVLTSRYLAGDARIGR